MPRSMPAGGYVSDLIHFAYVVAALFLLAWLARRGGWRRSALVLTVLGAFAALATSAEVWMRVVYDAPSEGLPTLAGRAWVMRHWNAEQNADGFRDDPWRADKAPGVRRIALLGDEAVLGWGIADREARAGDRLAQTLGAGHEIRNVAVPGWGTAERLTWIARNAGAAGIDRVILFHTLDDATDLIPGARFDVQRYGDSRPTWWNPTRSFLIDEIWASRLPELETWRTDRIATMPSPEARGRQLERMRRTVSTCASLGIPLDVVVLPWFDTEVAARDAVADAAVRAWREAGAAAVHDLRRDFAGREDELGLGDRSPWPNEAGHAVLAEALARIVGR